MFVFHSTFEVAGAGPAEDREKEESPWNWGHSYWFKLPELEVELGLTCAFTETVPNGKGPKAKTEETSSRTKIAATLKFLIIWQFPRE